MAFIINSLLDSNLTEQFAISGKKQVNTWRLDIYNICRLTKCHTKMLLMYLCIAQLCYLYHLGIILIILHWNHQLKLNMLVADYSYVKAHLRGFRKRTQTALDFVLVICKDISRTILLFTVISVTVHSFNLQISIFLVSGQYSL